MKALHILIVEDEVLIAETIRIYLMEAGHEVLAITTSFEEAMDAFLLRKPDLVILDIRLYGEKSGIDFAEYLTNQKEKTPFVFLTSQYDQRILEHALKTSPYGYLAKPIQKETLWTSVLSAYTLFNSTQAKSPPVVIFDGKNNHAIHREQILYIQAEHVYSKIFLVDRRTIITRLSLHQLLKLMMSDFLINCHRSFIINLQYITRWSPESVFINQDICIPISRSRKHEILERLKHM